MNLKELIRNYKFNKKHILIFDGVLLLIILSLCLFVKSPGEVNGLAVVNTTYDSAELSWDDAENADGYHVYRSEDGKSYDCVGETEEPGYVDNELTTGKKYFYAVSAFNGIRRNGPDKESCVSANPSLDTPKLKVSTKKGEVKLKIQEVEGATGYVIYRDDEKITEQEETTFVDENTEGSETYHYSVKAYREQEEPVTAYSDMSNEVKAKLVEVGKMTAAVQGKNIVFNWDYVEKYSNYKLYRGDDLMGETSSCSFTIYDFDPEANYDMKLVGYTEDGKTKSPEREQRFELVEEGMSNEEAIDAACAWGVSIAEDDEFTYGELPRALHYGCYFCNTNLRKKGSALLNGHSYEKTYICNALVHACYAHGAGDPEMLKACQAGSGIGMTVDSFKRYGNWEEVGMPDMSELKKGDVLVGNKNIGLSDFHHVAMYLGDGMILQATRKGWTPESIAVTKLSENYYHRFDFVMRYTGSGGTSRYAIEEVTPINDTDDQEDKD